jgi:hypothetical protein
VVLVMLLLLLVLLLLLLLLLRRASGLTLSPGRAASPYECAKIIPAQSGKTESSRSRPEPAHEPGQREFFSSVEAYSCTELQYSYCTISIVFSVTLQYLYLQY